MKMSDAIATGRVLIKPKRGTIGDGLEGCALGMAEAAVFGDWGLGRESYQREDELAQEWPFMNKKTSYPCGCIWTINPVEVIAVIVHIFDDHVMRANNNENWTLDQLIDWVRSVEPAETQAQPEPSTELLTLREVDVRS